MTAGSARGLFRATGKKSKPMLNAWFVWDRKHHGETVLRMLDRKDARQGEMFGATR